VARQERKLSSFWQLRVLDLSMIILGARYKGAVPGESQVRDLKLRRQMRTGGVSVPNLKRFYLFPVGGKKHKEFI